MDNPNNLNVPQAQSSMSPKPKGSAGSLTALIVILVLLAIGAFYFWNERVAEDAALESDNAALESINRQSNSDLEADIEADLNSTDIEGVDYDLDPENFNAS